MTDKLSLLAVFAHPGDESWGPGATLARYAHQDVKVTLVCATRGERSPWGVEQDTPLGKFGMIRVLELAAACKRLGIRRWTVLDYPDGALGQCDSKELEAELVRWIRQAQPQVVVTHHPEGVKGHPDHDALAHVTTQAYLGASDARRFPEQLEQGLSLWEPLKLYYAVASPDPECISRDGERRHLTALDVSSFAPAKGQALRCHASQEPCWRGLIRTLQSVPRWTEHFCLAHSRVSVLGSPEDDFYKSMDETKNLSPAWRRGAARSPPRQSENQPNFRLASSE